MPGAEDQNKAADQTGADGAGEANKDAVNAKAAGQQSGNQNSEDDAIYSDPLKVKDLVKSLREENAKHRTKNKELTSKCTEMDGTLKKLKAAFGGEEEVDPAQAAQDLHARNEKLQVELGIAQLALEHGISAESQGYFRFLLAQKFDSLEEGSEMTDEDVQAIVQEVGKFSKKPNGNSTGLNADARPQGDARTGITVETFSKMTVTEKSQLYVSNPEQYAKLFKEASEKKLL